MGITLDYNTGYHPLPNPLQHITMWIVINYITGYYRMQHQLQHVTLWIITYYITAKYHTLHGRNYHMYHRELSHTT